MTLAQVQKGTRVLDASGAEAGTVAEIKLGDPGAVTGEGQQPAGSGDRLADAVVNTITPDLPSAVAARLRRTGYLKVSHGLLRRDFYVSLDDVDGADGDAVRLAEDAGRYEAV